MFNKPTLANFQSNLDQLIHESERAARSARENNINSFAAKGLAVSGAIASAVVGEFDTIHKETVKAVMKLAVEFVAGAGLSMSDVSLTLKNRLTNFGDMLLGQIPTSGLAPYSLQQFRQKWIAVWTQRTDIALKDLDVGIVDGQMVAITDRKLQSVGQEKKSEISISSEGQKGGITAETINVVGNLYTGGREGAENHKEQGFLSRVWEHTVIKILAIIIIAVLTTALAYFGIQISEENGISLKPTTASEQTTLQIKAPSTQLLSRIRKLERFPSSVICVANSTIERTLDVVPCQLYSILIEYDDDVLAVPNLGYEFFDFMKDFSAYQSKASSLDIEMLPKIGNLVQSKSLSVSAIAWLYILLRVQGNT